MTLRGVDASALPVDRAVTAFLALLRSSLPKEKLEEMERELVPPARPATDTRRVEPLTDDEPAPSKVPAWWHGDDDAWDSFEEARRV